MRFYFVIECAILQNTGVTTYVSRWNGHSVSVSKTVSPDAGSARSSTYGPLSDVKQRAVSLIRTTWDDLSGSNRTKYHAVIWNAITSQSCSEMGRVTDLVYGLKRWKPLKISHGAPYIKRYSWCSFSVEQLFGIRTLGIIQTYDFSIKHWDKSGLIRNNQNYLYHPHDVWAQWF